MADNKSKIDQIHDLLPKYLNSKTNVNWKALVDALGEQDQNTADLATEVRKQFFVKTASRPYLDTLGANNRISRPRLVGMDDPSFRKYIPILSYQPKQVKLIIDKLLDIFFFKESTTAFVTSNKFQSFTLSDGWELELFVDELHTDRVIFKASDFTDISNATADEVAASINRQTKYCYATSYYDSITKNTYIRIFTTTIGSKGSLRILGGRANIALHLTGFIENAGNGVNTQWTVTKIGDQTTFTNSGGANPGMNSLQVGDIAIIDLSGNKGSFVISDVSLVNNSITFTNLFSTVGVFTNSSENDVKFVRPQKFVAYLNPRRAITWETEPGVITVEMPTSPPVVKRSLKGSAHINGVYSQMTNRNSDTSLTVTDAYQFPESGTFWLQRVEEINERILTTSENTIISNTMNTRLQYAMDKYEYTSRTSLVTNGDIIEGNKQIINLLSVAGLSIGDQIIAASFPPYTRITSIVGLVVNTSHPSTSSSTGEDITFLGNTLTGITPDLPQLAVLNEFALSSLSRTSNIVTGVTTVPHGFQAGETVIIDGTTGGTNNWNGNHVLLSASGNTFTYSQLDADSAATVFGNSRVERIGMANAGSKIFITDAISNEVSRITGPYVWDLAASFTLSSNKAEITDAIQAGKIVRLLGTTANDIPKDGGFLMFDYGKDNQEGPVRFLYKATDSTIALDPSYTFKFNHSANSPIVALSHKGPHQMTGHADEYAPYITNPSDARFILEDLIRSVKSAGIFIDFLIRYPEQLYGTVDVYESGIDPG